MAEGAIDAAVVYAANGPVVLEAEGIETDQIALDDFMQIPANGLVTNRSNYRDNHRTRGRHGRRHCTSIEYTLENPDEAFEIALKFVPEAGGENRDHQSRRIR